MLALLAAAAGDGAAASGGDGGHARADVSPGVEVVALKQSDFVLLVLLILALFYAGVAIIYRLALAPSKDQRLAAAQRRRPKRD